MKRFIYYYKCIESKIKNIIKMFDILVVLHKLVNYICLKQYDNYKS